MKNKIIIIASVYKYVYRAYPKINAAFVITQVIVLFGGTLPIIKSACSFANYVERMRYITQYEDMTYIWQNNMAKWMSEYMLHKI